MAARGCQIVMVGPYHELWTHQLNKETEMQAVFYGTRAHSRTGWMPYDAVFKQKGVERPSSSSAAQTLRSTNTPLSRQTSSPILTSAAAASLSGRATTPLEGSSRSATPASAASMN
eukprot:TRINITY_DN64711_c0_g1_i1.p1 TRINITY_DN64711_c0_g1~~TRINITY_DN64711_c0_g1_i1.p1  ORF type:complete len:132 (-),score=12.95 TRINITY_DN64711_c0_g1_i1:1-348(-)